MSHRSNRREFLLNTALTGAGVCMAAAATTNQVVLAAYHATATGKTASLPLTNYRQPVLGQLEIAPTR